MKILNSRLHGILDYMVVLFLWVSPSIFDLPPMTSLFTYILGGIHLLLTISTIYSVGLIKIIPFKVHGVIELAVSIALFAVGYAMGGVEGDLARNFFMGFGAAVLVTWLLTDYSDTYSKM